MEINKRIKSLSESQKQITQQQWAIGLLSLTLLILVAVLFGQSKIVVLQTPGMPPDTVIQKSSLDKGAERAVLAAVTSNMAQTNPENAEYQKAFLQAFLAPSVYTRISAEIDSRAKRLTDQRELGSYYFVLKTVEFDPAINVHYVIGDVHTVNAAKDTQVSYVFEYTMHVENYRPVIDSVTSYEGDKAHNSQWLKEHK